MPQDNRIAKLISRLGTDAEGERLAVLGALDRELAKAGVSWPEIAERLVTAPPPPAERQGPVFRAPREAASWVRRHPRWRPTDREREFVEKMAGWHGRLTEKQAEWLTSIVRRLGGEARL